MTAKTNYVSPGTAGRWEAVTTARLLPRCENCHAPHPLAMKPPRDVPACPVCDTPVADPEVTHSGPAEFTGEGLGLAGRLGFALIRFGNFLNAIAERLRH